MAEQWMIDELAYAGPEHLDPEFVAAYDAKAGTGVDEDLAILVEQGLTETATIVDLGAGTGRFALPAARRFVRVVAVDVSPAMLGFLRERIAEAELSNVGCVRAGLLSYEHSGPPVDAVYTRNTLHHLPDFWKAIALDRIAGLLRAGGILRLHDLIYDFQPSEAGAVFDAWFAGAASDPTQGYTREEYIEHVRTEYSTFRWLLEPMLAAAGFDIQSVDYRGAVFGAYTCVKR